MEKYNKAHDARSAAAFADKKTDRAVYDALADVFINGAYCARALTAVFKKAPEPRTHAFITSAFYGVLDKNIRLEKIIRDLCERPPQKEAEVVLKIGLYYLEYADMPSYAAVNRTVELSKSVGGVYGGFINAVLKKSMNYKPTFKTEAERFSYEHCTPEWLCKALISDYSETRAANILDAKLPDGTHIRPVAGRIARETFDALAEKLLKTEYGCYCDKTALEKFEKGTYAVQSLSSIKAVRTYLKGRHEGKILDLCAAPGGKSIYMSELGDFDVTACDVYPHKLELMRGYAKKSGAKIKVMLNDATVKNDKFDDAFDIVVADCPCSGTGTLGSKPDIKLRRKPSDIRELNVLQKSILDAASGYCKRGGILCYSTCSVLKSENESITEYFLSKHGDEYKLSDETKFLPDVDGCDGFYIARFIRL